MKQWSKLYLIVMVAAVISIITIMPVMADDNDNRMTICHYDNVDRVYKQITVGGTGEAAHAHNHENDIIPAPEDGCKTPEENEIETPDNLYKIISRTHTSTILPGDRLITEYYCESGEIIIGGQIEMPNMEFPLTNGGNMISSSEQSFNVVTGKNLTLEPIKVIVTYLCYTTR